MLYQLQLLSILAILEPHLPLLLHLFLCFFIGQIVQ